jgi:phage-related tail fiber protein
MANVIRIKRRNSNGAAGAPSSLQQAELALNEADGVLYAGFGTGGAGGSATTIASIGGTNWASKAYVTSAVAAVDVSSQLASYAPLASPALTGSPTATTASNSDNSTRIATTAYVQAQSYVTTAARLDQFASPTSSVSMNSQKLTNLGTPTADADAVTKAYADALRSGLDVKQGVRAATTANITLSGTQTIDGVAVIAGDRVLVKNQSTGSQNGIYLVAAGSWSRATDADADSEINPGMFCFVEEGTSNADTGWVCSNNAPTTVGSTPLTFAQFSGAGSFSVDATLTKTGNSIGLTSGIASAGTYTSVTVDTYGRVTAGSSPAMQSQITATGLLKGAGAGSVSAAVAGTDYLDPNSTLDCGSF